MNNVIIKKPEQKVLPLSMLKSHLRIANDIEDAYLNNIIDIATEILENKINKSLLTKTYMYTTKMQYEIKLPIDNVQKIISVNNSTNCKIPFKSSNNIIKIALNSYTVDNNAVENKLIKITYTAGITDNVLQVPKNLVLAVLQISKNIYECSEHDSLDNLYIKNVIQSYKKFSL